MRSRGAGGVHKSSSSESGSCQQAVMRDWAGAFYHLPYLVRHPHISMFQAAFALFIRSELGVD